jgi:N-acetylneuraminate lyase/4-hydroxy-tetrahydrodipicolinate synthase
MFKPEGVFVAMLTPFKEDGEINEPELRRIVDFLIEKGVDGLFPVSTVGEFVHLSQEEKMQLMGIVVDQTRGRVPVIPGVGSTHPKHSIQLAQKAKELGCDGVVIPPPYFYTVSEEMVEKYFETIADNVDIPVLLYNIPLFIQPLGYDVVKRLSRRPNVVGMKDSSGSMVDFMHFMDKARLVGEDIAFLTGREDMLFPALMVGAKGCMVAMAGILPEIMVDIYNAWKEGDYDRARARQFSILLLIRAMVALPFPLGFKLGLEMRGFKMGPPKQPLSEAERFKYTTVKSRIQKVMRPFLEELEVEDPKAQVI